MSFKGLICFALTFRKVNKLCKHFDYYYDDYDLIRNIDCNVSSWGVRNLCYDVLGIHDSQILRNAGKALLLLSYRQPSGNRSTVGDYMKNWREKRLEDSSNTVIRRIRIIKYFSVWPAFVPA